MLRPGDKGWPEELDADLESVVMMWRSQGVAEPVGGPFACVLHDECNARLSPTAENGHYLYHCDREARGLTVACVRALRAGRLTKPKGLEHGVWKSRVIVESGLAEPAEVAAAPLTDEMLAHYGRNAENIRVVWEGFLFLLSCRWVTHPGQHVTFTRDFAAAWCDVTADRARFARNELRALGLLVPVDSTRVNNHDAYLWLPAPAPGSGQTPPRMRRPLVAVTSEPTI